MQYTVFAHRVKIYTIVMSAASSLSSPVPSVIYLPALDIFADYYHMSVECINLSVTTYMVLQAAALFETWLTSWVGGWCIFLLFAFT
jgi:hypothetical protein